MRTVEDQDSTCVVSSVLAHPKVNDPNVGKQRRTGHTVYPACSFLPSELIATQDPEVQPWQPKINFRIKWTWDSHINLKPEVLLINTRIQADPFSISHPGDLFGVMPYLKLFLPAWGVHQPPGCKHRYHREFLADPNLGKTNDVASMRYHDVWNMPTGHGVRWEYMINLPGCILIVKFREEDRSVNILHVNASIQRDPFYRYSPHHFCLTFSIFSSSGYGVRNSSRSTDCRCLSCAAFSTAKHSSNGCPASDASRRSLIQVTNFCTD